MEPRTAEGPWAADPLLALVTVHEPHSLTLWVDRPSGLVALLAIDDVTLGPAAGGVRTHSYPNVDAAARDALALARAMTLKCALAGLTAGGGKAVVMVHDGLDRPAAFRELGRRIEKLGGLFRTAGDLGTTSQDLEAMATTTRYVHGDNRGLADAVASGLLACTRSAAKAIGAASLNGMRIAVQGVGAIGAAAARAFAAAGATLVLTDLEGRRAAQLAAELGAVVIDPERFLEAEVDVLAPCATGGVITLDGVDRIRARIVCGAANNILATGTSGDLAVAEALLTRGIVHVPDIIASAGAVIDGIGASVMGLADRGELIARLGTTTDDVLARAVDSAATPTAVALALAEERLASRRTSV